jgi:hypothetical protein
VELLTPVDIEREFRISGGHWHHGDLAFDQFFMVRPVPGAAQYRTPVDGLYLCGAGCHPGGGVMGTAGRNAARQVLKRRPDMSQNAAPHFRSRCSRRRSTSAPAALSQVDSFIPGRATPRSMCSPRGAGILRDPQRHDALRPDADGEVPDRRTGCAERI